MRARSLALPLVLVLLMPGCLGALTDGRLDRAGSAALSEARFQVLPGESVWIPSSADGTKLHAALWLPDAAEAEWKAPLILVMSPYFGYDARADRMDPASRPEYFRYQWLIDHFVPRGYAVALADVRGTGESGGCLEQTARLQWQDGHDVVEWFASQDWSNGKVGMFGKSYDAETQQSTAVMAPPSLVTIVPVASVSGQYEYSFYDGVPYTAHALRSNAFYMVYDGLQTPTTPDGLAQYPTRAGCHPQMLAQGLDFSGDWNAFWEDREIRHHVDKVRASVLYVHGFQDWNVKPVAIRDWFDLIPSTKRAIFGQWAHDYPEENRFQEDWSRQDWRETVHKWYDHFLLGLDNGILEELPPVQVQDSQGAWRREEAFPPRDARPVTLALAPGRLVAGVPEAFEPLPFRENEEAFARWNTRLPVPDVPSPPSETRLAFESEPLEADLRMSGSPTATLAIALTTSIFGTRADDAHFALVLYSVSPSGDATWINRAYLSARHRDGVDKPSPVPDAEPIDYAFRFFPQDDVVPAGHTLRLVLAGSDAWTQPQMSFWGAELHGGSLTLPVVERDLSRVGLDVPMGDPIRS